MTCGLAPPIGCSWAWADTAFSSNLEHWNGFLTPFPESHDLRNLLLVQAARGEFFRGVEGDVCDGNAASGGGIAGRDLHFFQCPHVVGDFHDVLDLEFFNKSAAFVVAADLHEGAEFGVDPDVNDFVFAGAAFWFVDAEFITRLPADVFLTFEFRVRPVEKAEGEIFVSEIGTGDGLGEFFRWEVLGLAVDHFEQIVFFIREAHVENAPGIVFVELELDVLAVEEERNRAFFPIFGEAAVERLGFVELGQGGGHARALEDGIGIGLLGVSAGDECGGDED